MPYQKCFAIKVKEMYDLAWFCIDCRSHLEGRSVPYLCSQRCVRIHELMGELTGVTRSHFIRESCEYCIPKEGNHGRNKTRTSEAGNKAKL